MIQMPESQMGSLRMRPSQLRIEMTDDQQLSSQRRNFMSPTALPLFRELQQQAQRSQYQPGLLQPNIKPISTQSQITKSLLFNIFLQGFFINYYAYLYWQFSFRYVLLQLWIQDLLTMFILIYFNYRKGEECIWQLIEAMFLFFLKVFIVFYYEIQKFKIYFITIMMIALSTLVLLMRIVQKLRFNQQNNQQIIIQFLKTLSCVQMTLIGLKWENQLSWAWSQIFIIVWVFLVVFALLLFISFIGCIETVINLLKKQTTKNYLIGNIWIFIHILGFTIFPFFFLYRISQFYDFCVYLESQETIQIIIFSTLYIFALFGYTSLFINNIRIFLKEMQGIDMTVQLAIQQQIIQDQRNNSPDMNETKSIKLKQEKFRFFRLNAPLYLIKMSCTYFAILDKITFQQKQQTEPISHRGTLQQASNRVDFQKDVQANSNSLDDKSNNIGELQKQKSDVTLKPKDTSKQIHEESEKSYKSQKSHPYNVEEQQSLQEKCLICYENTPNVLFVPCRHGGICLSCAEDIISKSNQCYLCRKNIKQILKIDKVEQQLVVNEVTNVRKRRDEQQ